ncbi:MAG: sulfatase-like hydrolase/transferase [Acidimicrobiales bacterium]
MAVAQPLLSVFGDNPEFFVFVNARRVDTIVFAVLVIVVPPLVIFAVEAAARLIGPQWPGRVHVMMVALLVYLFVVQLISNPSPAVVAVVAAAAVGGGAAWLYHRFGGFRTWTRILAVVPLIAGASFLFWSPTGELFTAGATAPIEAEEVLLVEESEVPPVILLVFDEFPTRVLLGDDGEIDASRYPNFARLAEDSTWYRSHSTVSPRTDYAVPAILTSTEPRPVDPLFTEHPDNMFRLFGETHHLTVSESLTALCPPSQCGYAPIPPPAAAVDSAPEQAEPTDQPTAGFDADPLYDRLRDVFLDRVIPGRDASGSQADFEETFVGPEATTTTTVVPSTSSTNSLPDPDADDNIAVEDFWIRVRTAPGGQPERYQDMLDTIVPTDEPTLWFLHLLLPHFPWRFHPEGSEYGVPEGLGELDRDRTNLWVNEVNRARLDLQTQYLDLLLGEMLGRFDDVGVYDDAVVAVVADHGESFELDVLGRDFENGRPSDVLYAPLFMKVPGQAGGVVSDANVSVFDVLPTIAAASGLRVPWDTVGADLTAGDPTERDGTKTVWRYEGEFEPLPTGVFEYEQAELDAEMLRDPLPPPLAPDGDPLDVLYASLGPSAELRGQSFSELAASPAGGVATVDNLALLQSPTSDEVPLGVVSGTVGADSPTDDAIVVLAVDDRIVALSPVIDFQGRAGSFVAVLPSDTITPGGTHQVQVGWWTEAAGLVALDVQ